MFGKLISSTIKIVTLPVDSASCAMDLATGGDGSKRSRMTDANWSPLQMAEKVRDKVAEAAESIDD